MRFIARLKAPMYPDAAQSAPSRPTTSVSPAPRIEASSVSIGSIVSSRALFETSGARTSMIASIDSCVCPKTPTRAIRAIRAGKIASTE